VALNPFFNNFNYEPEQELIQDLIQEAIQIYGHEVIYIPRNVTNYDQLYETDDQSTYTITIPVEMYIEDIDGFTGQRDIFTKFGLEIRDGVTLAISKRTYEQTIMPVTGQKRPLEGDLIYFTVNRKVFQIKYVNNKELFYPLGTLPTYQMELNLFEYSDETFNTGIPDIDSIQNNLSLNTKDRDLTLPDGTEITDSANNSLIPFNITDNNIDPDDDTNELESEDFTLIDFGTNNVFGKISN
jgi:hypothetical protein